MNIIISISSIFICIYIYILVVGPYSNNSNIRSFRLIFEYETHIRIFEVYNEDIANHQHYR